MHHLGNVDTAEVLDKVMGKSLTYTRRDGRLNIRPIKEVTMVEVARRYRIRRDAHRADDKTNPRPPKWASTNMRWPAALWNLTKPMSMRRRLFAVKVLYDKHFHGGNLKKMDNPDIDTRCQVCDQSADGHQHILRECMHPKMRACRRRWETAICRTVDAAVKAGEPMALVYKGYYNMAVDRRRDAHELWTGVLVECLPDLEQVAEAAPEGLATDLQFGRLRKHCSQYVNAAAAMFTVRATIMAEKRGQQARGVRAEMFAGSRRAKDDDPVGEDIRSALGTWPLEEGQPVEYRKRVLDSDDVEEIRALPEEEQGLARRTKVLRRYVPIQAVVKRPVAVEESNVAIRAWLGAGEGAAKASNVGKSKRGCVRGKGAAAVTRVPKKKGVKQSGQGSLAGWVVRTPKEGVGVLGKREEGDLLDAPSPGVPEGEERDSDREQRGVYSTLGSLVSWGPGDVGPVQPGYESGDTDAMLNAFERDTHRALADWVGDREPWPGWFAQGLHAMPPALRGYPAFEADRTRWVLKRPGGQGKTYCS